MKRRGIEANAEPMSLASRAIDLQSGGLRTGMLAAGFAIVTAIIYSRPPVDGIFWLFWLIPTFIFFSISVSRFVQAGMIKKLLRETALPAALPDREPDYHQTGNREEQRQLWGSPPASIYETDELERPSRPGSVADATTRHLR